MSWKFPLPTGEVVEINLPVAGQVDWLQSLERLLKGVEQVYPYMGLSPGVLTARTDKDALGTPGVVDLLDLPTKQYPSLSRVARWGSNDVIPLGWLWESENSAVPVQAYLPSDRNLGWDKHAQKFTWTGSGGSAEMGYASAVVLDWPPEAYACVVED